MWVVEMGNESDLSPVLILIKRSEESPTRIEDGAKDRQIGLPDRHAEARAPGGGGVMMGCMPRHQAKQSFRSVCSYFMGNR